MLEDNLFFEDSTRSRDYEEFLQTAKIYLNGRYDLNEPSDFLEATAQDYRDLRRIVEAMSQNFSPNEMEAVLADRTVPIVSHGEKIILIYDVLERFTKERALSFTTYPTMKYSYPIRFWRRECLRIDYDTPRAFPNALWDSFVDIVGERRGYSVVRIKETEYRWDKERSLEHLRRLVEAGKKGEVVLP